MAEIEKLVDEEDEDDDDEEEATALSSFNSPLLLCTSISQDTRQNLMCKQLHWPASAVAVLQYLLLGSGF